MKSELLEKANEIIPESPILINLVSKRIKELKEGRSPLVELEKDTEPVNIALMEIIENKITFTK